jgi:DNA-binding transcriptional LysR family regulator
MNSVAQPQAPTLDQLRVFLAIADAGSFAAAARRLKRATSVVSYQLANLEAQLGLALFERRGARKITLTDAGRSLLPDARAVNHEIGNLLAKAGSLLQGLEAEVSLAVDVMVPTRAVTDILEEFQVAFPNTTLRLHIEAVGAIAQLVLDGTADLGISGPVPAVVEGLEVTPLCAIRMIPVAAPNHPLAMQTDSSRSANPRDYVQLVLTDRSKLSEGRDYGVLAAQTWRLADLGAKHALLRAGVGWGAMPEPMVAEDLANGTLVRLALEFWDNALYRVRALSSPERPLGPARRWLLSRFQQSNVCG